jgi:hypothetical protein
VAGEDVEATVGEGLPLAGELLAAPVRGVGPFVAMEVDGRAARAVSVGLGLELVVPARPLTAMTSTRTSAAPATRATAGNGIPDDRACAIGLWGPGLGMRSS